MPAERLLVFDRDFLEDLAYWVATDRKIALRILDLVEAIRREPLAGPGKPARKNPRTQPSKQSIFSPSPPFLRCVRRVVA